MSWLSSLKSGFSPSQEVNEEAVQKVLQNYLLPNSNDPLKPNFINDDMEGNQRYYIEMDLSSLKHTYSSVTNDEVNLFSIKLVDQYISNKKEDNISGMLSAITQLIKITIKYQNDSNRHEIGNKVRYYYNNST